MSASEKVTRGRPRSFEIEPALGIAQALFQAKGYDSVSVAMLTEALSIKPPSFYAAFGSKAALFERVLDRYATQRLPLAPFLKQGIAPAAALRAYLQAAARVYSADAATPGCLILDSARGVGNEESTAAARCRKRASRDAVAAFVRRTHPAQADIVADFILATTTGLSAAAKEGQAEQGLVAIADMAAASIDIVLGVSPRAPDPDPR